MVYQNLPYEKVWYGEGVVCENLVDEIIKYCSRKILIVTTESLIGTKSFNNLLELCSDYSIYIYKSKQHVPIDTLVGKFSEVKLFSPDLIISVGGGSSIDSAKIMSAMLGYAIDTKEELINYAINNRSQVQQNPLLPHLAIPTTLSAAEFSGVGGFSDETKGMKYGIYNTAITPSQIFLDPTFSIDTPLDFWISTGMRSVDHAVETVYSPIESPVNHALALKSLTYLFQYLPMVKENPTNLDYRLQCQLGAWMSFFTVVNTKMGLSHMIGHQLGAFYGIPHGVTSAIMLANVMDFMLPYSEKEQLAIFQTLNEAGLVGNINSNEKKATHSSQLVRNLVNQLEIPSQLRDFNVSKESLEKVLKNILSEIKMKDHSLLLSIEDLEKKLKILLMKSW
ncbi:iron-containing alcohol dehydrogenase [Mesobacillus harenae]|uniref:iron-containing alcohol dehydrogenase n=1 Tax=Mesobacillus harenae TaxID=2213203 RepID=UPI0015801A39|nr:iron-containing alcohol dehydrogenase [Mesobacillus harenae]